ncbi:hypothetical protein CPB84DRAFT_875242 [Gymnopilus junonius]|uniref:Uncharacterized protein n=1 Tax=Gymnopilus junonius TaxID=109634 RepID=A0A9P5NR30_GYMJU|nr:hypothetical protein CPB84DRAFT_875242 [Gymnopilus junonius]
MAVGGKDVLGAVHRPSMDDYPNDGYKTPSKRLRLSLNGVQRIAAGAGDIALLSRVLLNFNRTLFILRKPYPFPRVNLSKCDNNASLSMKESFSEDGVNYKHVPLPVPSVVPWIGSGSVGYLRGAYDEHDGVGNGVDDEDKENLPPPTSSFPSSMLLDDRERGIEGAGDNLGDEHGYLGQAEGWTGSVGYDHEYDYNQDYVMDVQPPYTPSIVAADQLANTFAADQVQGGFGNDIDDHDYPYVDGGGSFEPLSFGSQYPFPGGEARKISLPTLAVRPNGMEYGPIKDLNK